MVRIIKTLIENNPHLTTTSSPKGSNNDKVKLEGIFEQL
jgi:hypothetical protein